MGSIIYFECPHSW